MAHIPHPSYNINNLMCCSVLALWSCGLSHGALDSYTTGYDAGSIPGDDFSANVCFSTEKLKDYG